MVVRLNILITASLIFMGTTSFAADSGTLSVCPLNSILSGECKALISQVVTSNIGTDITSWSNASASTTLESSIPDGYYQGKVCAFTDTDLIATNVRSGTDIFGVAGSLVGIFGNCSDGLNSSQCSTVANRYVYSSQYNGRSADCSAGLNASACWTNAANRYVSSTLGSSIVATSGAISATIPSGYYDGTTTAVMSDGNLLATNIKNGVSIFGVTGSLIPTYQTAMASQESRDKAQAQVSLRTEATAATAYTNSPTGYRAVPSISKDDDGAYTTSVTKVDRSTWGATTCGTSQATVALRIADCAVNPVIGPEATWNGAVKGNAGQGLWKLVTRTGDILAYDLGREVWQDQRTGLLWSSRVSSGLNWCKASGSNNITGNPVAQVDPSGYCNNATYQTTGTGPTNKAVSACFEDGENYFTSVDPNIDNAGKAGLGLGSTPSVAWRMPTAHDYFLANANGLKFILPEFVSASDEVEWSATVSSSSRMYAYLFYSNDGRLSAMYARSASKAIRCVGR